MEQEQHFRLLQRARLKNLFKRTFLVLAAGLALYYLVAIVYATHTIYKVRRNYAVVLEDLSGERRVVESVGWHARLPFFSRLEQEVPLMNQELQLGGTRETKRIMSRGNVALWTSAMLTYRITDLHRWGIENREPLALLQTDYDGIVMDVMQSRTVDELVSAREQIKEEIFLALKRRPINAGGPTLEQKYGIEVISFVLRETRYGDKLAEASEEKKRRELIAEAENYAADLEASRTRKLYTAYSESIADFRRKLDLGEEGTRHLFEYLNQQKWAAAYEKNQQGQNTFVLHNSGVPPAVTLPPLASPVRKERSSQDGNAAQDPKPAVR